MDWYYVGSGQSLGPIDQAELERLVREGSITADTLVWHAGLGDWQPYSTVATATPFAALAGDAVCSECGGTFSQNDMIRYADSWVCAACKPVFVQKLKEGAALPGTMVYGGFWLRFLAKLVDWVLLGVVNSVLLFVFIPIMVLGGGDPERFGPAMVVIQPLLSLIGMVLNAAYTTFFLGRYGATLGKMACGLKVVTADGGKVSYARALGRYFAEILSGLTLYIGYIIAAFDEQKRTLHDHICNTRVVKK